MTYKERAAGGPIPAAGETQAGTVISTGSIPQSPPNPTAENIRWMRDFAAALDERTLTVWALRLIDAKPAENRRAYAWQQLSRIELRRRHRNIDVATLDCCPRCGVVGLWSHDKCSGASQVAACHRNGGAS